MGTGSDSAGCRQVPRQRRGWEGRWALDNPGLDNPGLTVTPGRTPGKHGVDDIHAATWRGGSATCPQPSLQPWSGQRALTAQVRCPPEHTGLLLGALLSIGGHSRAEALTVPACVTGAGVLHTGLVEDCGVHLRRKPGVPWARAAFIGPGPCSWALVLPGPQCDS